MMTDKFVHKVV